jgi:hypothetical protein
MIAKIETGNGFGGSVNYDLRVGLEIPLEGKVLMLSGVEFDLEKFNEKGILEVDPRQVGRDFRFQALRRPRVRKPVYHWVLSWKSGEPVTDEQMKEAARKFMRRMGFVNTQYIITRHDDKENIHCHIILNIVNNDGQRISTHRMIDKCHRVAKEITKEMGFAWGEKATKESIKTAHKPHEKAAVAIRTAIDMCKAKAISHAKLKEMLASVGIEYKYTIAQDGKRGRASFAVTYKGQLHTFKGSDVKNPFGLINATIEANRKQQEETKEFFAEAAALYNPMVRELNNLRNDTAELYKQACIPGLALRSGTKEAAEKLQKAWDDFDEWQNKKKAAKTPNDITEAIGAILIALNPLVGFAALLLGWLVKDIDDSQKRHEKRQLLAQIDKCRADLEQLEAKKAELPLPRNERVEGYLLKNRQLEEYRDAKEFVDERAEHIRKTLQQSQPRKINGPKL